MFEQSVHSGVVIACCDAFCHTITKKTVVVLDNASIHTSEAFEERLPFWKKQGLILKYLPPYSPELNLIEILWRHIKYRWLPFSAYQCLNALIEALENILSNVGSKYQWLNMRSGELREQELEQGSQQRFSSSSHVVNQLKEAQIQWQVVL